MRLWCDMTTALGKPDVPELKHIAAGWVRLSRLDRSNGGKVKEASVLKSRGYCCSIRLSWQRNENCNTCDCVAMIGRGRMINDHYCRRASKLLGSFNDIGQKFHVHCHHDRTSDAKVVYELEARCQRIHTTETSSRPQSRMCYRRPGDGVEAVNTHNTSLP
jgi:hypothetical protein